jgi:phage antirepressor YoqD-like protein
VTIPRPVTEVRTGKRGRPRKSIDPNFLRQAFEPNRRIKVTRLAKVLGMTRQTLTKRLKEENVFFKFSQLSNDDLDILVRTYRTVHPNQGERYLFGFLRRHGIRLQKDRIRKSIMRVDRLGLTVRQRTAIKRTTYKVKRPNALWHGDGHHKLILWGIVIHGFVDCYSRTVSQSS